MLLEDLLAESGAWLFRWRSYLPLALLALIAVALHGFDYPLSSHALDLAWEAFCLAVSMLGLAIRVLTVGFVPARTSGRNTAGQVADVLNTTGMYSITRNPLYVGNFFMYLGIVLFVHDVWLTTAFVLAFALYYERIIIAEERFLHGEFGEAYAHYARTTPAFLPDPSNWVPPSMPFSARTVLRREYAGFFAVIACMTILEVAGDRVVHGEFEIDPVWAVLFAFGAAVYLVLRTLKHHTTLLDVEGR